MNDRFALTARRFTFVCTIVAAMVAGCLAPDPSDPTMGTQEFLAASISFEAETLARTSSAVGTNVSSGDSANSNSAYVQFKAGSVVNDWIEFTLPNLAAGSYEITLFFKANTNRAIHQARIDGVVQGAACDEYASAIKYQVACKLGSKLLVAGNHKLRFTLTGKNSASSGTTMTIDKIVLTQIASGTGGTMGTGGATGRGGASGRGGSGGTSGFGGSTGTGGSGGTTGRVFSQCRFHFGTGDSKAKANPSIIPQIDFFTPGWLGWSETFDQGYVCTEANPGGVLANKVPVVVAYAAAFYVKRHYGMCDCNVYTCGTNNDLCHYGAQYISLNLSAILNVYKSFAQGYANCYGTTRPIIFEMEPDWYQYTGSSQTQPWSPAQAGQIMSQLVATVKQYLPNAVFSMDVSPWVGNNGADNGAAWFANFDMSQFTFVNTSGGGTNAGTAKIRSSNNMTWAGLHQVTGKPILADTGYGANGSSAGHDPAWDDPANINARIADGVISISQYNPSPTWGTTLGTIRPSLNLPGACP